MRTGTPNGELVESFEKQTDTVNEEQEKKNLWKVTLLHLHTRLDVAHGICVKLCVCAVSLGHLGTLNKSLESRWPFKRTYQYLIDVKIIMPHNNLIRIINFFYFRLDCLVCARADDEAVSTSYT